MREHFFHKIQRYYGHLLNGFNLIRIQNNSSIKSYVDVLYVWYIFRKSAVAVHKNN